MKDTGDIQIVNGVPGMRKDAHMCIYRMDQGGAHIMGQQIAENKELAEIVRQGMDDKTVSEETEKLACLHMVPTVH